MNTVSQIAQALQEILNERAEVLAKETKFIQRVREVKGADFAQTLIFGWLQEADVTMDGLTQILQRREVTISGPGLSQRFTQEAAMFLQRILEEMTARRLQAEAQVPLPLLQQFSAVVLEDSSTITLPDELAEQWRGCGGSHGASNAALKLFVRWDVLNGRLQGPSLTQGRHSDGRSPFSVEDLPDQSLYLADLGFFGVERLATIARRGESKSKRRYFITRWQPGTALSTRTGHRINLHGILPMQVGQRVELGALLGVQQRLPVRVLIERVPQEVAQERQERIREAAQAHGRQASEEIFYLANWTIVLTNVPRRMLDFDQVLILLRLRWQIERLFRLWKEHGHIDEWRSKKPWRILCEIYAKLSAMVIQQWLVQAGCWREPHRSLFKAAQAVRREANRIMVALSEGGLEATLRSILRCLQSGCRLNTRQQEPSTSQFLLGLPLTWPEEGAGHQRRKGKGAGKGRKAEVTMKT